MNSDMPITFQAYVSQYLSFICLNFLRLGKVDALGHMHGHNTFFKIYTLLFNNR